MITFFQQYIHRHGRMVFAILLFVIIVAFVFMDYAGSLSSKRMASEGTLPVVYGRKIGYKELEHQLRVTQLNMLLMTGREVRSSGEVRDLLIEQTLTRMALARKATEMGVHVSDQEVLKELATSRLFQKNGQYDPETYNQFVRNALGPRSLSERDFEEMMRENLQLNKLMMWVGSTSKVTDNELNQICAEFSEKITAVGFRFDLADFTTQVKPTEEDLKKFHESHKEQFMTPEKVRVAYVSFPVNVAKTVPPTDDELMEVYQARRETFRGSDGKIKPIKEVVETLKKDVILDKARQDALRLASDFTVRLVPEPGKAVPKFEELAKEKSLIIKETPLFSLQEGFPGSTSSELKTLAHHLSAENAISDPVLDHDSAYVLKFLDRQASELPALEKIKDAVKSACIREMAVKMAQEAGNQKLKDFASLLQNKKTWEQASTELKLKSQKVGPFSAGDAPGKDSFENDFRSIAFTTAGGAISEFTPTATGGYFVYVISRASPSKEDISKLVAQMRPALVQMQQRQTMQAFQQMVAKEGVKRMSK